MIAALLRWRQRRRLLAKADYLSGNAHHHLDVAGVYAHQALCDEREGQDSRSARELWAGRVAAAQAAFDRADALREGADRL